jgi:hypothetical protein
MARPAHPGQAFLRVLAAETAECRLRSRVVCERDLERAVVGARYAAELLVGIRVLSVADRPADDDPGCSPHEHDPFVLLASRRGKLRPRILFDCHFRRLAFLFGDVEVVVTFHDACDAQILVSGQDNEVLRVRSDGLVLGSS